MTKSSKTYEMEEALTLATWKLGLIGCAEVGLGDDGIVDFITIELGRNRICRCYELKITKSDFLSDAKKTFIGEYNYYVVPTELYPIIKNYIEPGIGCVCCDPSGHVSTKLKARYKKCDLSKGYITTRITQALYREHMKYIEQAWIDRWTGSENSVSDYYGHPLSLNDTVKYENKLWTITEIAWKKQDIALIPYCRLNPIGRQEPERAIKSKMLVLSNE